MSSNLSLIYRHNRSYYGCSYLQKKIKRNAARSRLEKWKCKIEDIRTNERSINAEILFTDAGHENEIIRGHLSVRFY